MQTELSSMPVRFHVAIEGPTPESRSDVPPPLSSAIVIIGDVKVTILDQAVDNHQIMRGVPGNHQRATQKNWTQPPLGCPGCGVRRSRSLYKGAKQEECQDRYGCPFPENQTGAFLFSACDDPAEACSELLNFGAFSACISTDLSGHCQRNAANLQSQHHSSRSWWTGWKDLARPKWNEAWPWSVISTRLNREFPAKEAL